MVIVNHVMVTVWKNCLVVMDIAYVNIYLHRFQFRLLTWTSYGTFVHPVGGEATPAASNTLLEYMTNWCDIQEIIEYRFL